MTTTIQVTKGTNANLENYKRHHGLKSKDDAIRHLLSLSRDKGDDVPDDSDERDGMDGEDDNLPKESSTWGVSMRASAATPNQ